MGVLGFELGSPEMADGNGNHLTIGDLLNT